MGLILRPSPAVFRRGTPLFLIAGAYRSSGRQCALSQGPQPLSTERSLVRWARTLRAYHATMGFVRYAQNDPAAPQGSWLKGCRPCVSDRVFDLDPAQTGVSASLLACLDDAPTDGLILCGDPNDSLFQKCFAAATALRRDVRTLTVSAPLQNCTAATEPEAFLLVSDPVEPLEAVPAG